MTLFEIAAILVTASALGGFVNYKWIKLPSSIGLVLLAMTVGLLGILFKKIGLMSDYYVQTFLSNINFEETVFHGMLSFLLFSGGLQIDKTSYYNNSNY
jgi:CPA1 family monovalent cation:H+ antiporter